MMQLVDVDERRPYVTRVSQTGISTFNIDCSLVTTTQGAPTPHLSVTWFFILCNVLLCYGIRYCCCWATPLTTNNNGALLLCLYRFVLIVDCETLFGFWSDDLDTVFLPSFNRHCWFCRRLLSTLKYVNAEFQIVSKKGGLKEGNMLLFVDCIHFQCSQYACWIFSVIWVCQIYSTWA